MTIALGNDHAGFPLRQAVSETVAALGHRLADFGTDEEQPCDYPDVAREVAQAVARGECDLGILICGTGIGMSIAANKIPGAYAARCEECFSARMARTHNNANILCLGGRTLGPGLTAEVVAAFLCAEPSPDERHHRRQDKVRRLEAQRP